MFLTCCTTQPLNLQRDLNLETGKRLISSKVDVVDNPNVDINYENKDLFETMKCDANRLYSFEQKWPLSFININELVESGFFYLQSDDRVQCAFCKLVLGSWKVGDKPLKEHIKSSPKCPFMIKPLSKPNALRPKNPLMVDVRRRLSTFRNWPHSTIKVQNLADCGLYYTGLQDIVTCFHCGGSLANWEPFDEPILEHAKFYPECNYLKIIQNHYRRTEGSALQTGENVSSNRLEGEKMLKSDMVKKAKEIFPSSMVDEVVVRQLQIGETFSSLHQLCDKLLEQVDRQTRSNPVMLMMDNQNVVQQSVMSRKSNSSVDVLLCKICMEREREIDFRPCGHVVSCRKCAEQLTKCPLCRKNIDSKLRTFLS